MLRKVTDTIAFLTIIPVPTDDESFERATSSTYLLPLVGWLTGLTAAAALLLFSPVSPLTGAIAALAATTALTRALHFDALTDTFDALTCHADTQTRIQALKDQQLGAGGTAAALAVYGLTAAALAAASDPLTLIIVAEVTAKLSTTTVTATARPLGDGLGSAYINSTSLWHPIAALILSLPLLTFAPYRTTIPILAAGIAGALILTTMAHRQLGGANGDVLGATNEIARLTAILAGAYLW